MWKVIWSYVGEGYRKDRKSLFLRYIDDRIEEPEFSSREFNGLRRILTASFYPDVLLALDDHFVRVVLSRIAIPVDEEYRAQ